jgi:hypothetical protein
MLAPHGEAEASCGYESAAVPTRLHRPGLAVIRTRPPIGSVHVRSRQ